MKKMEKRWDTTADWDLKFGKIQLYSLLSRGASWNEPKRVKLIGDMQHSRY